MRTESIKSNISVISQLNNLSNLSTCK